LVHTGGAGGALSALRGAAVGAAVVAGVVLTRVGLGAAPAGRAISAVARLEPTMTATATARINRRRAGELGVRLMWCPFREWPLARARMMALLPLGYDNVVKWNAAM
jgi:hypothetical protein